VTPEGEVRFYTGDVPRHETLVRVVTPEGEVRYYEGEERLVRAVAPDGTELPIVNVYDGND